MNTPSDIRSKWNAIPFHEAVEMLHEIDRALDAAKWKREPSPPEALRAYNAKVDGWIVRVTELPTRGEDGVREHHGMVVRGHVLLSVPYDLAAEWFLAAESQSAEQSPPS